MPHLIIKVIATIETFEQVKIGEGRPAWLLDKVLSQCLQCHKFKGNHPSVNSERVKGKEKKGKEEEFAP